jgi:type IV secretion system protein VirB8
MTLSNPQTSKADMPVAQAARAQYYEAASTWAQDTLASLRASRRTAWLVAGVAIGLAALQCLALVFLLPLKQPVPYTITVDRETGYVSTARGVDLGPLSENQAIAQSFLVQYVLARETFDFTDYRESYRKTLLWSQGAAETDYLRDWDRANPNSVHNRYRPTTRVKVNIKSVTVLGPKSALVRFDTEQTEGAGSGGMRQAYAAAVSYEFSGKPLSEADRYLNPFGFQVSSYRRDMETVSPVPVAAPPQPVPSTAPAAPIATPTQSAPSATPPNPNPGLAAPEPAPGAPTQ